MRVLQVEDDPVTARAVEQMMKSKGYACWTTAYGEEAVELATDTDFDLILLDIMLPDIDGYEVLRRLQAARVGTPPMAILPRPDPSCLARISAIFGNHHEPLSCPIRLRPTPSGANSGANFGAVGHPPYPRTPRYAPAGRAGPWAGKDKAPVEAGAIEQ